MKVIPIYKSKTLEVMLENGNIIVNNYEINSQARTELDVIDELETELKKPYSFSFSWILTIFLIVAFINIIATFYRQDYWWALIHSILLLLTVYASDLAQKSVFSFKNRVLNDIIKTLKINGFDYNKINKV